MVEGIYEELKGWQSGLGALLGLFALMAAALWNFRLNRLRDAELRREEAASVATALYGEILLLRKEIARLANVVAKMEMRHEHYTDQFVDDYRPSEALLYQALAPKLGLLSPELLLDITRFHAEFEEAKRNLPLLVEREPGIRYSPLVVLEPAVRAVEDVTPTLRKIEKLFGIPEAAEPDTDDAKAIIEKERGRFEEARAT